MSESAIKNCAGSLVLALCALLPAWSADHRHRQRRPRPPRPARSPLPCRWRRPRPLPRSRRRAKPRSRQPRQNPTRRSGKSVQPSTPGAAEPQAKTAPDAAAATPGQPHPGLKGDVIRLNRDLLVLEEELLFPANTQVALFVSMDVGKLFELDSVQIKLDDKVVANYLYTPLEVQALHRGGVQRVYLGNLKAGDARVVAFFTGKGPHERDYKRGATVKFDKGTEREVHRAAHQGFHAASCSRSSTSRSGSDLYMRAPTFHRLAMRQAATPENRQRPAEGALRRRLMALAAGAALASVGASRAAFAAEPVRPVIKEPHYGDTLFHFFQDHYFTSITSLMASQHFEPRRAARRRGRGAARRHAAVVRPAPRGRRDLRAADRQGRRRRRCATAPGSTWPRSATSAASSPRPKTRWRASRSNLPPDLEEERVLLQANC